MQKSIYKKITELLAVFLLLVFFFTMSPTATNVIAEQPQGHKVQVIMYHNTSNRNAGRYCVTPAELEEDLLYLQKNNYSTIVVQDLIDYAYSGTPLPQNAVMLTFDDGLVNNFYHAFPLLKKYNAKAVFSVLGKQIYDNSINDVKNQNAHLSSKHIVEMAQSGLIEFANHSYNLHITKQGRIGMRQCQNECDEDYQKLIADDLTKCNDILQDLCNIKCTTITYPFGAYSKKTEEIIKEMGFFASISCTEGINYINNKTDLYLLKRYNRPSGKSIEQLLS